MNKGISTPSMDFLETKEYHRFAEFCDACRDSRYIGLCYGKPGVGKTLSARHYARWDLVENALNSSIEAEIPEAVMQCRTILYTPPVYNSPRAIERDIDALRFRLNHVIEEAVFSHRSVQDFREHMELIIVDEADRLKVQGLEQMRDMFDKGNLGMVFIGIPGIEKRLSRHPQLYSRVGFAHQFQPLNEMQTRMVLEHKWLELGLEFNSEDQETLGECCKTRLC